MFFILNTCISIVIVTNNGKWNSLRKSLKDPLIIILTILSEFAVIPYRYVD